MLPKKYLSYSQYALWNSSKVSYRKRYYENIPIKENAEMIFGKKIGRYLEEDHPEVDHIEKYDTPEHRIELEIDGVKLLGYIDSYDSKNKQFIEYKTSHKDKYGKDQWNALKVQKHEQLDWYSMLIQEKYGEVVDKCKLIYLETEINDNLLYKGVKIFRKDRGLRLTGKVETFEREIEQWERDFIKEKIIKTANEIKEDYARWRKENNK
jgi:hypothetical protein